MSYALRRAQVEDAPKLAKVHVDSWQAAYRGIVPDIYLQGFTCAKREKAFQQALTARTEETYLLEEKDTPIAILTIGPSRDDDLDVHLVGELWGIYISPDYWRRGIGRTLVKEAEHFLHARGYLEIVLWVLEENTAARQFYETMGFHPDEASKIVELGKPLRAVRYRKILGIT